MPALPFRTMLLAAALGVSSGVAEARSGVVGAVVQAADAPSTTTLHPGDAIEAGQTIATRGGELVNLLFTDGTSVTIGPESTLSIDTYDFDATSGKRQLAMTLRQGVCRLIGAAAKSGDITLSTRSGAIDMGSTVASIFVTSHATVGLVANGKAVEVPVPPVSRGSVEATLPAGSNRGVLLLVKGALTIGKDKLSTELNQAYLARQPSPTATSSTSTSIPPSDSISMTQIMDELAGLSMSMQQTSQAQMTAQINSMNEQATPAAAQAADKGHSAVELMQGAAIGFAVTGVMTSHSAVTSTATSGSSRAESTSERRETTVRPPAPYTVSAAISSRPFQVTLPPKQ